MKVEFMFGTHFVSEKMAIDFLKTKNRYLENNENVSSAIVQVHHNKENSPLYITFHIHWQKGEMGRVGYTCGGRMLEFSFIDYYNWFEETKSKYYTKEFFSNHMSNLLSA